MGRHNHCAYNACHSKLAFHPSEKVHVKISMEVLKLPQGSSSSFLKIYNTKKPRGAKGLEWQIILSRNRRWGGNTCLAASVTKCLSPNTTKLCSGPTLICYLGQTTTYFAFRSLLFSKGQSKLLKEAEVPRRAWGSVHAGAVGFSRFSLLVVYSFVHLFTGIWLAYYLE